MRRALLIGCQTDGLVGVHADLDAMAALLERYRFTEVTTLRDEAATRASILAGIDALIARTTAGDAVVVYYSGHGWWVDLPRRDPTLAVVPRHYQGISPWDLRATRANDFRGILGAELATKLAGLTARTDNVSVILDCCHATGAVRGGPPLPGERGLPVPWTVDLERCLATLRAEGYALERRDPECNPLAVRLLACSPHQRAFEDRGEATRGGLLTRALVAELAACGHAEVVWEDLARRLRAVVGARQTAQHPVVLGPARRFLFSSDERCEFGTTAVLTAGARHFLVGGAMTGMQVGDRFAALPLAVPERSLRGGAAERLVGALARLEVTAVHSHLAEVRSEPPDAALPDGSTARPIAWATPWALVALAVREAWRPAVAAALTNTGRLGLALADDEASARVVERADGLVALDGHGLPLGSPQPIVHDADLDTALLGLCAQLGAQAQVDALRRLRSPAPLDPGLQPVELAWYVVDGERRPLAAGACLRRRTRVTVRATNPGGLTLHVSVLLAGPGGRVRLLSRSQPTGVELAPGETYWLGEPGLTGVEGVRLDWPEGLALDAGPRRATLVCVVADMAVDLRAWETDDPAARRGEGEPEPARPPVSPPRAARWAVTGLDIVLEPRTRPV